MTDNPFAALLRDVPRYDPWGCRLSGVEAISEDETMLVLSDVLAVLAAAVPDDLAEAEKVLERLSIMSDTTSHRACGVITALLARIAAQEAVNRAQVEVIEKQADTIIRINARAEAAETALAAERAKVAKLVEALTFYSCKDGCNDCSENERDLIGCGWTARAAITEAGQ